jgi:hypothetical protein
VTNWCSGSSAGHDQHKAGRDRGPDGRRQGQVPQHRARPTAPGD